MTQEVINDVILPIAWVAIVWVILAVMIEATLSVCKQHMEDEDDPR